MNKQGASPGFIDTLWKFFASVRLTVVLLLTLAVTSIIGTLIPQNAEQSDYIRKYGVEMFRVFSALDLTDMYHSSWFRFFMTLLTMNVVVCSLDRLSATLKIVFVKMPNFNIGRFRRLPDNMNVSSAKAPTELLALCRTLVTKWFGYSRTEKTDRGVCIFAEKGRWARMGFYLVHLSIVLLLTGGLIGSIFGFDGFVNIVEGESVNQVRKSNAAAMVPLDFRIQCDDFSVSFYDTGQPKEFRSRLTILEADVPVLTRDIIVNQPLRYKGINIFQSSYGQLPPEKVILHFEDRETNTTFSVNATMGQAVTLPENRGTYQLKNVVNSIAFRGMDLGQTVVGLLTLAGQPAKEILLPTRFPTFDKMRKGRFVITLGRMESRYYTGLQVTRDPGVWLVYLGFIMLIGGCFVTFFLSHQRACIEIVPHNNGSAVLIAGTANKNKLGMQNKVKKMAGHIAKLDSR